MKQLNLTCLVLSFLSITISCKKTKISSVNSPQNGVWVGRANFPGLTMGAAASFVVNNNAFIGTGMNPTAPKQKLTTMYKYTADTIKNEPYGYDSAYGSWTQVQSFPGQARSNAVGFNIGNTGYLGSGLANDGTTALADFYAYNAAANTWSTVDSIHNETSSFPRFDAVAFSFDTTAYVLTGQADSNYFDDVWRYSPTANTWIQQPYYPGSPRAGAVTFVYKDQGYLVTGHTPGDKWSEDSLCYDFWRFTPGNESSTTAWARLNDIYNTDAGSFDAGYKDIIRYHASSFMILGQADGDKGYVTCGGNNGTDITSTWEYDFASDRWKLKTPFSETPRSSAVSFTLTGVVPSTPGVASTRGFVATGLNQGSAFGFTDCVEFFPVVNNSN